MFTIIELLIVCVVISILMAIAIGIFQLVYDKMNNSKTRAIIKQLDIAMQSYKIDQGYYFINTNSYQVLSSSSDPVNPFNRFNFNYAGSSNPDKDFIKCFEYQSLIGVGYIKTNVTPNYIVDAWGRSMLYKCPGDFNPQMFDLGSLGRDGKYGDASTNSYDFGKGDDITNFNNN